MDLGAFQALLDERARLRRLLEGQPTNRAEIEARLAELQTHIDAALREAAKETQ